MEGIQKEKYLPNWDRRRARSRRHRSVRVKSKDIPVSDMLERLLNCGIAFDASLKNVKGGIDLTRNKSRVVVRAVDRDAQDEKPDRSYGVRIFARG